MTDNVTKIKDRLDIVDVLSGYIKTQKAGVNFKARCPFHNEKTPSFYISPERQIWHCFGCGDGGDMFSFVKKIEGVEFPEALRILAAKAGVEIDQHFDPIVKNEKNQLHKITETATRFFEKQLNDSVYGKKAMDYLTGRGLTPETIKEFRLGYAPNDWYSLSKFLLSCGFSKKEIVDAGMAFLKEGRSDLYDRFRLRIMFPIFDVNGEAVGFTGRMFEVERDKRQETREVAKYINTPQTQIYDKSRVLYGLHKAKGEIRANNCCVLVEGNMDMLMSYQAGAQNVIASSGTALTLNHLKLLGRYTNNLSFCFDTDQAGALATKRGIGLALKQNFNIKVININDKECKDPADFVKKYLSAGRQAARSANKIDNSWQKLVESAKPVVEYYFDKVRTEFDMSSANGKKSAILVLAPFIKRLASQVEKSHWISQLAFLIRVGDEAVKQDIQSAKDDLDMYDRMDDYAPRPISTVTKNDPLNSQTSSQITGPDKIPAMPDIYNETLLSVIIKNPGLFKEDLKNLPDEIHPFIKEIVSKIGDDADFKFDKFLKTLDPGLKMQLEFAYLRSQELWRDFKDQDLREEFNNLINKIKHKSIIAQLTNVEFDIKEAETSKDKEKISNLILQFNRLTEELSHLHYEKN